MLHTVVMNCKVIYNRTNVLYLVKITNVIKLLIIACIVSWLQNIQLNAYLVFKRVIYPLFFFILFPF